ncbi:MAG: ribonuclease III domain-containing protein, partial [Halanaerobacter sp.]
DELIELPDRPKLLSPEVMAYIGDGVYELFIRNLVLAREVGKGQALHEGAVKYVNASAQAKLLEEIRDELSQEEESIVRRGRNCQKNIPSNADPSDYCYSTGFEALLGYLYLKEEKKRLSELLKIIKEILDQAEIELN